MKKIKHHTQGGGVGVQCSGQIYLFSVSLNDFPSNLFNVICKTKCNTFQENIFIILNAISITEKRRNIIIVKY